jgi:hypothetical protein
MNGQKTRHLTAARIEINFLNDENVRIRSCQEIDLFLGWNQWQFDRE